MICKGTNQLLSIIDDDYRPVRNIDTKTSINQCYDTLS